jgi:hypothetical protein
VEGRSATYAKYEQISNRGNIDSGDNIYCGDNIDSKDDEQNNQETQDSTSKNQKLVFGQ